MTGLPSPDTHEGSKDQSVKIFRNAQEAIDAVQKGNAAAVWKDTYMDQINPSYITFFKEDKAKEFDETLRELGVLYREKDGSMSKRMELFDKLNDLASTNIEPGNVKWVYKDGEWAIKPEELLEDESSTRLQEEDHDWYQAQRDHFSRMPEPDPLGNQSERMRRDEEKGTDDNL